nr:mucin-3A-like [Penaeus vannamei]
MEGRAQVSHAPSRRPTEVAKAEKRKVAAGATNNRGTAREEKHRGRNRKRIRDRENAAGADRPRRRSECRSGRLHRQQEQGTPSRRRRCGGDAGLRVRVVDRVMGQGHTHLEDECTDSEEEKFYNSELEDSQSECEEDACDKRVTMEARARQATAARLRSVWNEAKKNSSDSASEYEEAEEDRGLQPPLAERSSPLGASHSDGNTSFRGPELTDAEDEQGCTEACRYQQAYFFGSNTSLDSSISQPSCASLDSRLAQISGSSNTYHSRALPRNFFLDLEREGRGCASASATPLTSPQSPSETRRRWDKSVWPEVEKGLRRNQSVPDIDPSRSEDRRHRVRGRSPSPKRYTFDEREKRQKIIDAVTRRLYPGSGPGFGRRNKKVSEKPQVLGERECRCRKKPGSDGDISASKNSVTTSSCELLIPKIPRKISLPTPVTPPAWRRSSLESPPGSFLPIPVRDHSQAERTSTSPQKESASTTLTRSSRITRREVKTVTTTVTKTLNTIERKIMTNVQQDMTKPDMQDQAVDCDLVDRDSCEKVSCESKGAQADMQVLETSEDQEENDDSQSPKKCVHPDPDLLTDVNENDSAEKEGRRKIPLTPALHQLRQALASLNDPERFSDDSLELGNLDADSPSPASRFSPRAPEEDEISLGDISKDSLEDSVNIDVESRKLHAAHDPTVVQEITACDIVSAMPGPRIPKLSKKHDSFIQSFFRSVSASDMKDSFELEEESLSLTDDNSETLCLSPSSAQTLASKPSVPVKPNSVTPPPSSSSSRNTRRWTRERAEKRFVESTSSEESDVDSRQRPRFRKRRVRRMSLPLPSVPTMDLCEDQDNSDCTDGAALKLSSHETVDSAVCASVKDINANKMLTRTQSKELLDRNRRYTSESVGECGVEDVSVDIASTERKQKLLQFKQKYKNESSQPSNQDSSVVESMSPEYYSPHLQDPVISVPSQAGSNQQFSESDSFSDRDVETQTLLKESARKLLRTVSKEGPLSEASQDAVAELLKASSKRLAKYALSMPEDGSEIGSASLSRCESVATQDEDYDTAKGEDSWLESSSEFQSALKKNGVSGSHSYTSNTTTPARELLNKDEKKQSLEGQGNLLDVVQSSSGGDVSPRAFAADGTDYSTTATTPLASSASEGFSTEGSWEDLDILDPHSKGDVNLSEKQYQVIAAEFTPRTARRLLYTIIECSESSRSESVPSEPDIIPSDWQETMSETEDYNMSACMSPEISEDLLSSSDDTMLDTVRRNVEDPQDSLSCISDDILGDSKAHTAEGYPAESFQELPWNAAGSLELLTSLPITPDCLDEEDNPWETDTKGMDQNFQDESNQETCTTLDSGMVCTKSSNIISVSQYSQNQEDMLPEFVPYLDLSEVAGSPIKGHVVNKESILVSSQDEVTALERHEDVTNANFNVTAEDKTMQDKMGKLHSDTSSAFENRRTLLDTSLGLSSKMPKYTSKGGNSKPGALHQEHLEIGDSPDTEIRQFTQDSESYLHTVAQTNNTTKEMNIGSQAVSCSVPRLTTAVAVEFPWQKIDDVSHSSHPDDYLVPVMTSGLKAESSQDSDMEFDSLEQIQETYTDVQHPQCTSDIPQSYVLEGDNTEAASSVFNKSTSSAAEAQRLISPLTLQNPLMGPSNYEAASSIESQMPINVMEIKPVTMGSEGMESSYLKQMPPLTPQNSVVEVGISEASSLMLRNQSEKSDCSNFEATLVPQNSLIGETASTLTPKDKDVEASCQHLNLQTASESTEVAQSGLDPMVTDQSSEKEIKQAPPLTPQNSVMEVSISEASSLLTEERLKSRTIQISPLTPQNSMVDVSISEAASYVVQDAECMSEELLPLAHNDIAEVDILEANTKMLKNERLKSVMQVSPLTPQHSMVDVSISEAATSVMLKNYEYMQSQNAAASPTVMPEANSRTLASDTATSEGFHEVQPQMPQNSFVGVSIKEAVTSVMLEGKEHALDLNTQSLPKVRSKADSMLRKSDTVKSRTFHEIPPLTPQNSMVEVSTSEASSVLLERESIKLRSVKVCPLTPQNSMIDISITEAACSVLENAKSALEQPISSVDEETTVDTIVAANKILLDDINGKSTKKMIPFVIPENSTSSEAFGKSSLERDCSEEMTLLSAQFSVIEDKFTEEGSVIPEEVKEIKPFSQMKALTPQNSFVEVSISEASSLALENVRLTSITPKQATLLSPESSILEDSFGEAALLGPEKVEQIRILNRSKALTPQNSLVEVSISEASSLANVSLNSRSPKSVTLLSAESSVLEDSLAEAGSVVPEEEAKIIKKLNQSKTLTPQNSFMEVSISEASSLANAILNFGTSKPTTLLSAQSSVLEDSFIETGPFMPEKDVQEVKTFDQAKALTPQNSLKEVSISEASSLALENVSLASRTSKHGTLLSAETSILEDSFAEAAASLVPEKEEKEIIFFSQSKALTPQNSLVEVSISEASSLANSLNSRTPKSATLLSAQSSILEDNFAEAGAVISEDAKEIRIFNQTKALTPQNSLLEVSISEASSLALQDANSKPRTCRQVSPLTPQNSMVDVSISEASTLASERNEDMYTNLNRIPPLTPQNSMADISVGEAASVIVGNVQGRSKLRHLPPLTPQNTVAEISLSEASSLILATEGTNNSSLQEFSTEELPVVSLDADRAKSKSRKFLTPLTPQNSVLEVSISEASTIALEDEALKPSLKQVLPLKLSEGKVMSLEMESVRSMSSKEIPPLTPQNSVMEVSIYEAVSSIADSCLGSELPVTLLQESTEVEGTLEETHNIERDLEKVLLAQLKEESSEDACFSSSVKPAVKSVTQIVTSDHSLEVAFPLPQDLEVDVYQETTSFLPQRSQRLVTPLTPQNSVADYETSQEMAKVLQPSALVASTSLDPRSLVSQLGKVGVPLHSTVAPIPEDRLHDILQEGTGAVMPQMAAEEFQALTHVAQMPVEGASSIIPATTPLTQKTNTLRPEITDTCSAQADHQTPHVAFGYQVFESQTDQLTLPQESTEESQTLHPRTSTVVKSVEGATSCTPQEFSEDQIHPLQQMVIRSNQVVNLAVTSQLGTHFDTEIPFSPEVIERDQKVIHSTKSELISEEYARGQTQFNPEELHLMCQLPPHSTTNVQAMIQKPEVVMKRATTTISGVAFETQQIPMEETRVVSIVNQSRLQRSFALGKVSSESDMEESCSVMTRLPYTVGKVQAVTSQVPHNAIEENRSTQALGYETPLISKAVTSELESQSDNVSPLPFHATTSKLQTEVSYSVIPLAPQTSSTKVWASTIDQTQPLTVEEAMTPKALEVAMEEASYLQEVTDSTPKLVKEGSGQAATLNTPNVAVEREASEKAGILQTSQMSEVAIPTISQLAIGEVMSLQTMPHQALPLTVEEDRSVQVVPLTTPPLAIEKSGNVQLIPQSQHMALEENRREHEVIFHPVTSTLSVEESPPVTPLTPEIATGVLVTSHEFPVEGSSSDWTMTYQTAEVSSDQALPHKTPVIVMGKARSAQETAQINVDGTAHAQASIQQMSQMALEGVVVQTPTHQAETSSLDLEESHAVIPLLPQKTTTVRAVTHQTSHISEQGILQSPQVATETCPDQTKTLQAPQVAVETSIVPTGTHTAPQVAKETISGQTAIVQEPILALETSIDQTVIHQTPQMTVESGYGQSLRTPVEASNCQAVTSQVSRAVAKTLQTPQSAVETNFGEAVISPNMGINVRTVDMAKTEGKSVQELKYLDSHSVMEEAGSAQTMPQVAKERIDSAQAVNQTSEMVMEKTRTLAQQAAISHIGLEDRHAVIPLLPEEMSRMPVVIHKMPHVVNEEMSSAQAMASSVQAVTPQTLQMGESTSAQPAFVQTSQMITPETSRAQAVLQQAVTSDIDLKEMHFVKPLLPQDTDSLRAVMRQTSQVTEEGTSSAHAVIQQAVSSELDLEDSHTVLSLLPQDTITARTVVHQAAQKAKEGMASAQIMFVTPQMPLGEVSSTRAVTQQAASSKLHLDETHSVIPLVPQDTGNVRAVIHQTTHMTKEGNDSIQAVSAQATQMAMGEDGSAQVLALQTSQIATARADSAQAVTVQIPQIAAVGTSSVQPGTAHMTRMAMKETCSAQLVTHQTPQMTMGEAGSVQTVTAQTPQMAMDGTSGAQVTGQRTQAGVDRVSSAHAVTIHTPQLAMEGASSAQAVSQVALEEVGSAQAIRQAVSSQLGLLETDSVIPLLPQDADTFKAVICQTPQVATEGMDSTQTVIGQTPQMTLGGASSTQAVTVHQMAMGKAGSAQAVTIQAPQIAMEGILSAQAVTNDQIAQAMNVHTRQIPVREASSTQAENLHTPQMALREASSAETVTAQITQMAMGEASSAQALVLQTPQMVMGKTSSAQAVILETPKAVIQQAVSSQQSLEEIHFLSPLLPQDTNSVRTVIRQTPQTEKEGTSSAQTVIQQAVTSQLCLDETHALAKEGMGSTQTVIVQTPQMVIGEACSDQTVTLEAYQLATESVINTQTTPIRRLEIAKEESSSAQAVTVLTPQMSTIVTSSEQAVINQIPQMPMIPTSSEQAVIDQTHQMSMIPTSSEQVITDQKLQTTVIVPRSAGAVIQYAVTSRSDLDESQSVISLLPQDSNFRAVIHQTPQEGAIRHQAVTLQTPQMTKGKTSSDQTGSVRPVIGSVSQVAMDEETVGGVSSAHAMTVQTPQMALETGSAQAVSLETPQMTFGDCSDQAVTVQTPQMA